MTAAGNHGPGMIELKLRKRDGNNRVGVEHFTHCFAHQCKSAFGSILDHPAPGDDEAVDAAIDGAFLAREEFYYGPLGSDLDDASRRPFIVSQNRKLTSVDGIEPDGDAAVCNGLIFYVFANDSSNAALSSYTNSAYHRGMYINGSSTYTRGTQTAGGPLAIAIHKMSFYTFDFTDGDAALLLHFEDASGNPHTDLKVWLPSVDCSSYSSAYLTLWVAEDGSTYWADASKAVNTASAVFDHEGYFAVRWAHDNLARAAYSGRYAALGAPSVEDAQSPAIDAGSRDYLNAGWTWTNFTAAIADLSDNAAQPYVDDPDNLIKGGNRNDLDDLVAWSAITILPNDPYHKDYRVINNLELDMGYHHGGMFQQKHSEPSRYTTLRHPKERIIKIASYDSEHIGYTIEDVSPLVSSYHSLIWDYCLASGRYDASSGEDLTVAIHGARGDIHDASGIVPNSHNLTIACLRFRDPNLSPNNLNRVIDEHSYLGQPYNMVTHTGPREINCLASAVGPEDSGDVPIYAAAATIFSDATPDDESFSDLDVYRYDETSNTWIHIAAKGLENYMQGGSMSGPKKEFSHVRLAAQDDDLWILWVETNLTNQSASIHGQRLAGARTATTLTNLTGNSLESIPSVAIPYLDLASDWDEGLGGAYNGFPRIVYPDDDFDSVGNLGSNGVPELVGAQVLLDNQTGYPLMLVNKNRINDYPKTPAFSVNHPDTERFPFLTRSPDGFCRFLDDANAVVRKSDVTNSGGVDSWQTPQSLQGGSEEPAVVYRAFGTPRTAFIDSANSRKINTDDTIMMLQCERKRTYPHLETQRVKKDNVFMIFAKRYFQTTDVIDIVHLQP